MKKRAFIFYGGWDGHEPDLVSARFKKMLEQEGLVVIREDRLDRLADVEFLKTVDLIIPCWTQAHLDDRLCFAVSEAIESGVGIAGCHGGMCDAFRNSVEWQFITGSQWVAHAGPKWAHHISHGDRENLEYVKNTYPESLIGQTHTSKFEVNFKKSSSSLIIQGLDDFSAETEQYYLHVDPSVDVLASTLIQTKGPHSENGIIEMPVVYTKRWGKGRVFYNSMGHVDKIFEIPQVAEVTRRGFLWAAR